MNTAAVSTLGIIEQRNVETPARDGTVLRGNLWRPDAPGEFPALLLRTPYGKAGGGFERFVRAGYAVLCQDVRGRYDSDGDFTVFSEDTLDPEDGYDTVEWLADQPWCNGRIGTTGASYCAWTQWALAKLRPPHLVAMCARSIPTELRDIDWWGAFRPGRRIHWWLNTMAPDLRLRAGWPPPHTPAEARTIWNEIEHGLRLGLIPWSEIVRHLPPPLDQQVARWLQDPGRRVWRFDEAHGRITVPNLDFTGWFDHCQSIDQFTGMRANGGSEIARNHTQVVIGPWSHVTVGRRECLGVDFGPAAAVDAQGIELRWFDHWLKDADNGVDRDPPVRYFVLGSGQWKTAETWPPPGAVERTWYLDGGGHANRPDGHGVLSPQPGPGSVEDRYVYDPRDPVPTLWTPQLFAGAADRNRLAYRRDILVYRTPVLEEDIEIAGRPELVLHAATSAPDTDFFAFLIDEQPDGGPALQMAFGMVRARHRNSLETEDFVEPGAVIEYRIRLGNVACRFKAGHRIRLDITSSDFPNFDRNHNTGKNDLFDAELRTAQQTVLHSAPHPSRILLPGVE